MTSVPFKYPSVQAWAKKVSSKRLRKEPERLAKVSGPDGRVNPKKPKSPNTLTAAKKVIKKSSAKISTSKQLPTDSSVKRKRKAARKNPHCKTPPPSEVAKKRKGRPPNSKNKKPRKKAGRPPAKSANKSVPKVPKTAAPSRKKEKKEKKQLTEKYLKALARKKAKAAALAMAMKILSGSPV